MDLPIQEIKSELDVCSNEFIFYKKDNKFIYMQVKSGWGGTPIVDTVKHPNTAIWLLIGELKKENILLYKLCGSYSE
jgi:hypothetical protein